MNRGVKAAGSVMCLFFTGCFPAKYTVFPQINGRVIDENRHPVSGATVEIVDRNPLDPSTPTHYVFQSDRHGRFGQNEKSVFLFWILVMSAPYPHEVSACAMTGDERSRWTNAWWQPGDPHFLGIGKEAIHLGDLVLLPKQKISDADRGIDLPTKVHLFVEPVIEIPPATMRTVQAQTKP